MGFPEGSVSKEPTECKAGDAGEDPLEKEMAIHSRILARKIPWTETPGRLQSREWQRVGPYQLQKLIKPGASLVAQYRRCGFNPWSRKIPYAMEQLSP